MIADPLGPRFDKKQEVGDILGIFHVWGLIVNATDAANHRVVSESHFVGDIDRGVLILSSRQLMYGVASLVLLGRDFILRS